MNEGINTDKKRRLNLLGVQSLIGGLIVLVALLLHLFGGTVYAQLKEAFDRAMTDDSLAQAISQAWETGGA